VVGAPLEDDLSAGLPGYCGDEAQRFAGALEARPLLDVQLDKPWRLLAERLASQRARLFGAERDDSDLGVGQPLNSLDAGDDTEGAVKPAAVRHRVEVRAGPHPRLAAPADQIAGLVAADLEPSLAQPTGGQLVRSVLFRRVARTRAATDRVQLVEPLQDARGYSPNGLNGFGLVETRTLFVSR
jgi:hypothetical protein